MLRGEQTELQLLCFAFHYSAESPSVSESSFLGMNSLFDELGVLVSPERTPRLVTNCFAWVLQLTLWTWL